jgi:hypothetical protein
MFFGYKKSCGTIITGKHKSVSYLKILRHQRKANETGRTLPDRKRPLGRLVLRWEDNIRMDLKTNSICRLDSASSG